MSTYDPKNVIMNFGLALRIQGFASGSMIAVRYTDEGARSYVGTTGEAVGVKSYQRSAEITVRLMATGAGRRTLAVLLTHFNAGNVALPLAIVSRDTGEALVCPQALIKQYPGAEFGGADTEPMREIMFTCPELRMQTAPATGIAQLLGG